MTDPDLVKMFIAGEVSTVVTPDGVAHLAEIDEAGRRFIWIKSAFARLMLNSGLPCSLPLKAANIALSETLGPMPKLEPGIHIAAHLQALERMRPLHPCDVKGTLRELGVLR